MYNLHVVKQHAQIAQLVEQRTENPCVAGSIPALGINPLNTTFVAFKGFLFCGIWSVREGLVQKTSFHCILPSETNILSPHLTYVTSMLFPRNILYTCWAPQFYIHLHNDLLLHVSFFRWYLSSQSL